MEGYSIVCILVFVERKGTAEHLKAKKCLIKFLSPLCNLLLWIRLYIDGVSLTMIDFIDWLETF